MGTLGVFLWNNHDRKKGGNMMERKIQRAFCAVNSSKFGRKKGNRNAEAKVWGISECWPSLNSLPPLHGCLTWLRNPPAYFPRVFPKYSLSISCQIPALSSHTWLACSARADLDSFAGFRSAGSYGCQCSQMGDRPPQEQRAALPALWTRTWLNYLE